MGKQPYVELSAEHVVMVYLGFFFFLVKGSLAKCYVVSASWCEGTAFAQLMVQYEAFSF